MPEVFTCECGNQEWIIYSSGHVECPKCRRRFNIMLDASMFNLRRDEHEEGVIHPSEPRMTAERG